jgi:hypothetical protein
MAVWAKKKKGERRPAIPMAVWAKKKKERDDQPYQWQYGQKKKKERDDQPYQWQYGRKKTTGIEPHPPTGGWAGASREEEEEMRLLVGRRL